MIAVACRIILIAVHHGRIDERKATTPHSFEGRTKSLYMFRRRQDLSTVVVKAAWWGHQEDWKKSVFGLPIEVSYGRALSVFPLQHRTIMDSVEIKHPLTTLKKNRHGLDQRKSVK